MDRDDLKRNSMEEYMDLLAELVDGIDEECKAILEKEDEISDVEMLEYVKNLKEATELLKSNFNRDNYLGK